MTLGLAVGTGSAFGGPRPGSGSTTWTGNGTTGGTLNVSLCGTANGAPVDGAYLVFVLAATAGMSSPEIRFGSGDTWHPTTKRNGARPGTSSYRYLWTSAGSIDLATVLALPVEARWSGSAAPVLTVGQGCTSGGALTCTSAPVNTSAPYVQPTFISGVLYVTVSPTTGTGGTYGTWTPGTGTCTITGYTFQWQWSPPGRGDPDLDRQHGRRRHHRHVPLVHRSQRQLLHLVASRSDRDQRVRAHHRLQPDVPRGSCLRVTAPHTSRGPWSLVDRPARRDDAIGERWRAEGGR